MPLILTRKETLAWIRSQGLDYIPRLPKNDRMIYISQAGGGLWEVRPHISGGFTVEPSPVFQRVD